MGGHLRISEYDVFAEAYHLKVTPRTDACNSGAAEQQPLISRNLPDQGPRLP